MSNIRFSLRYSAVFKYTYHKAKQKVVKKQLRMNLK